MTCIKHCKKQCFAQKHEKDNVNPKESKKQCKSKKQTNTKNPDLISQLLRSGFLGFF